MAIDRKAAKLAYKSTITPMGIYCLRDGQSGRCVVAAERNLPSVMSRVRFIAEFGGTPPAGPLSDPRLGQDYRDHPEAFTFEVLEAVDVSLCATYEEAADKLRALEKAAQGRYAHLPRYIAK